MNLTKSFTQAATKLIQHHHKLKRVSSWMNLTTSATHCWPFLVSGFFYLNEWSQHRYRCTEASLPCVEYKKLRAHTQQNDNPSATWYPFVHPAATQLKANGATSSIHRSSRPLAISNFWVTWAERQSQWEREHKTRYGQLSQDRYALSPAIIISQEPSQVSL